MRCLCALRPADQLEIGTLERIGDVVHSHANDDLAPVYELELPSRTES